MSPDRRLKSRPGRTSLYYQRAVPKDLQHIHGKVIEECLHTSDKKKARRLRDIKDVQWDAQFDKDRAHAEEHSPLALSKEVLESLKAMLSDLLKANDWPDPTLQETAPWEDMANEVRQQRNSVPVALRQQVFQLAQALSEYHADPTKFDRKAALELVKDAEPAKSMADLRDLYIEAKRGEGRRPKSVDSQESRLAVLEAHNWDVSQVRQMLLDKRREPKTIENWLTTYATFSRWLEKKHKVELEVPDFKRSKHSGTRDVFTVDELRTLYAYPMDETMKWVCLVCLHQGFRASEPLQLNYADIRQHHGVWVFDIHDRGDKTLKTGSTARKVPVHPWLIEHGFLDYWKKHKGWARMWKSYDGTASQGFSKAVNKVIREALGLKTSETETGKKVFHSFRHTFRDHAREAGLQEYTIDVIGGWSLAKYGEGASYGQGHGIKGVLEVLSRVDFGLTGSKASG